MSCRAGVLTLVLVASAHAGLNGQQPGLQFDVASVRPCDPAIGVYPNVPSTGNRFYRGCTSVRSLVDFAYGLPSTLFVAIPPWAITERWTIDARPARAAQLDEMRAMVRHLLATRFAFQSHVERRQIDVYDLVLARRDRTLGPKARRATVDCMPFHLDTRSRAQAPRDPSGREQCPVSDMTVVDGDMLTQRFYGMTAPHFASQLSSRVGRLVIDKTGLTGLFNFDVTWRRDDPEASPDFAPLSDQRAVFIAALSQQLGLRLEPAQSMVERLIVDSIERPAPN